MWSRFTVGLPGAGTPIEKPRFGCLNSGHVGRAEGHVSTWRPALARVERRQRLRFCSRPATPGEFDDLPEYGISVEFDDEAES